MAWIELDSDLGKNPIQSGGGGGGGAVDSVNGQTGVVVLDTDDIPQGSTNLYAPTGGPNLFSYFDGSSILAQLPNWNVDVATTPNRYGLRYAVNIDPFLAGANYSVSNQLYNNLTASSANPNDTEVLLQLVTDIDPGNTGIGFGTNGNAVVLSDKVIFSKNSTDIGGIVGNGLNISLGDVGISGGSVNGITGNNVNIVSTSGYTISNSFRAYNFSTDFSEETTIVNGLSGYSANINVACNFANYLNYFEASGVFEPTNPYSGSVISFYSGTQIAGQVSNPCVLADYNNLIDGANVTGDYRSIDANPTFSSSATVRSYTGINVGPSFGSPITNDAYAARFSMHNCVAGNSITGISIDASSALSSSGNVIGLNINVLNSLGGENPQGPIGIESNGRISVNATTQFQSGQTVQIGNRVQSLLTVPSGSPVTGSDLLCNNFAGDFVAEDNVALGPVGIGVNSVGFIASLGIAATKTIDSFTVFLPACALPDPGFATGGSITDFHQIRVFPPLPQGGTANITNAYAFKIDALFGDYSSAATNTWGLYFDSNSQNYIKSSLNIAGSSGKVTNSSVGLEIGGATKAFLNARMTSTERDALTAVNGMQIYNTTTDKLQVYAAGSWVDLH